jgi:hypothetical protein
MEYATYISTDYIQMLINLVAPSLIPQSQLSSTGTSEWWPTSHKLQ